jgi:hypothetical protein
MDLQKAIIDFVIVTIPGALLYFLGWAYLYYYLYFLGINVSELKLDTATIFIYSYSPIYDVISKHIVIASLLFFILLLTIFTTFFDEILKGLIKNLRKWSLPVRAQWFTYRRVSSLRPLARIMYITVVLFLFILIVINFILIPIARWSAKDTANQKWSGDTRSVTVNLNKEAVNLNEEAKANSSELVDDFTACQNRGGLVVIFSDEETLFLLCRSPDDPRTGSVFEVKKDKGLVSSRYVVAGG